MTKILGVSNRIYKLELYVGSGILVYRPDNMRQYLNVSQSSINRIKQVKRLYTHYYDSIDTLCIVNP